MSLMSPFSLAIVAIVSLSLIGVPIGHAMIGGSVLYLLMRGMDIGTAAEQLLNGMYGSFLLLAIPLFILAGKFTRPARSTTPHCSASASSTSSRMPAGVRA